MNRFSRKQTRSFERLEDRSMLAGNVSAVLSGGCLTITGDSKDNVIAVFQNNQGAWVVAGFAGTKIQTIGNVPPVFGDVSCIHIDTGSGNDIVGVGHGFLPEELVVNTGSGNDAAILIGLKVGSLDVDTGTGNDLLLAAGIQVQGETPEITPSIATSGPGSAVFNTGDGNDIAVLAGIKATNVSLCTGKGNDMAGLLGVCVDKCLSVDTGSGTDLLGVVKSSAPNAKIYGGKDAGDVYLTAQNHFDSQKTDFKITVKIDPLVQALSSWAKSLKSMGSPVINSLGAFPDLKI